uniref:PHD finger protein 10 n=1 Tax=Trichobilharzia regenti TaxID=157069 RepID=A0AA85JLQ7_TRIRE|nr:unnamed protein product [Trichobilharzia regenti]
MITNNTTFITTTASNNHPCTPATTASTTIATITSSTATATATTPNNNNNSNTIIAKLTDCATYFAVVSDTCAFNRNLCKNRCSRIPFLDLATHISQRPAPWLHQTYREYSRGSCCVGGPSSKDPHVFLRYPRYRWHLDDPSSSKKRKTANQRLWYTLQNGLKALGVPPDLVPVVTRRAYSIAGLSIPVSLANYRDYTDGGHNSRVVSSSVSHAIGINNNNNTNNNLNLSIGIVSRSFSGATTNASQRKNVYNNNNYGESEYHDTSSTVVLHEDDEVCAHRSRDSSGFLNGDVGGDGGDEIMQSFDGLLYTLNKRNKLNSDDFILSDRKDLHNDDSRQNMMHIISSRKSDYCRTYNDLDNISEDYCHENGGDVGEYGRQLDENDDDGINGSINDGGDNDCEENVQWWSSTSGSGRRCRRLGGGNRNAASDDSGAVSRRGGKHRSSDLRSVKMTKFINRKIVNQKGSRSSQNFPVVVNNRLGGRRFAKRHHLGRSFAGRLRTNESHMDDDMLSSYAYATKSNPSVGRRGGSRAMTRLGTRHMGDSLKTLQHYGSIREKMNHCNEDPWDDIVDNDEPGYQLNAPSLVVVHDKCRDSQTFVDCHSSSDQFNALKNNTYSASSSFSSTHSSYPPPSTLPPPYQHHPSSSIYAVNLSNHCFPECFSSSSSPVVLSQTKFIQSCVTPMNWSNTSFANQSNMSSLSSHTSTSMNMNLSSVSSSCIVPSSSSLLLSSSSPSIDSTQTMEELNTGYFLHRCSDPRPPSTNNSNNNNNNEYLIMPIGEFHRGNMSRQSDSCIDNNNNNNNNNNNCIDVSMNRGSSLPLPVIADYSHNNSSSTTSGNNNNNSISTVSHLTFSINDTNNNSNNNNNNNNGRVVVGDLQTIVNPQQTTTAVVAAAATTTTTTTTVTFFICEVCSSRYRSTAGLRYHYHSQHSGYTPQNPISASAARLVVPIGEERGMGVGGGLRGGRPRRHRGSTASSKSRDKLINSHYSSDYQGSTEQEGGSNSFLSSHYSKVASQSSNSAYSPPLSSSQMSKRGQHTVSTVNRMDCKPLTTDSSRSMMIVEPKLVENLIVNHQASLKYYKEEENMPANHHFNSTEPADDNELDINNINFMRPVIIKKSSTFMKNNNNNNASGDCLSQCSLSSVTTTPNSLIIMNNSAIAPSRYQIMDYNTNSYSGGGGGSSNNSSSGGSGVGAGHIPHSNIPPPVQQHNSSHLSLINSSSEMHFSNNNTADTTTVSNNNSHSRCHPQFPYSSHPPHSYASSMKPSPHGNWWNSQHLSYNQLAYTSSSSSSVVSTTSSIPSNYNSFPALSQPLTPQQQHPSITFNRISPQQRRYERQNCRDSRRLGGLVRSSVNPSTSSTTTALSSVPICDYCLGSEAINPRIGHSEGMLHCSRCGHYGHYTCLRLSPHVIEAAVRYPWQCIGCKTCWLCDQGDQEVRNEN